MHISYESGILEKPECSAPENIFTMTNNSDTWPNDADLLKIEFLCGIPIKVKNLKTQEEFTDSLNLFKYVNNIGYLFFLLPY